MAKKKKRIPRTIENIAYAAVIEICERKENERAYRGNGHHLAQQLATAIAIGFLSKQQKEIYDLLSYYPPQAMGAAEIGEKLKLSSGHVSAQLQQIHSKTLLLSNVKRGRYKFWYKHL